MNKLFAVLPIIGIVFCAQTVYAMSPTDSIRYIDDRKLATETLVNQVEKIISVNPSWGISELRKGFDSLTLDKKIKLNLPARSTKIISGEQLYAERSPGVLLVGRYYDCGRCPDMHAAVTATAAVLTEDGICVTNDHVMEGLLKSGSSTDLDSVAFVGTIDGKVYPIVEVLSYSKVGDISIFRVDTGGDKLTPVPLGESLAPGAKVRAITHPSGNYYYYSEGVVSRYSINSARGGEMSKRMEITADYAVGSSGGPIFDEAGNLVGMVSTTTSLEAGGRGPNNPRQHQMTIKRTVPVSLIKQLIQ